MGWEGRQGQAMQGLRCRVQGLGSVPGVLGSRGGAGQLWGPARMDRRGKPGDWEAGEEDEMRVQGEEVGAWPRAVGKERRGQGRVIGQEGQG